MPTIFARPHLHPWLLAAFILSRLLLLAVRAPLLVGPETARASLSTTLGREARERVWAILDGNFAGGSVAAIGGRYVTHCRTAALQPLWQPVGLPALFGLVFLWFYRPYGGNRHPLRVVAATTFTLVGLYLYSRGYIPRFLTWVAPLVAILFPGSWRLFYLGRLGVINVLEVPLYFRLFPERQALPVAVVTVGTSVPLAFAWHCTAVATTPRPEGGQPA